MSEREVAGLRIAELSGDPNLGTIILLHGFGADAYDLFPLAQVFKGPQWIFPQAPLKVPLGPNYVGRAWFHVDIEALSQAIREKRFDQISEAFPPDLRSAQEAIENLIVELDIPRSKLILGGFSQGAVLAIETSLQSSLKCGGLLIFSGTLIHETQWRRLAPLHAHTPFFQSHGSNDPLLPMEKAEDLEKLLIDSGLKGQLHRFHGGHEIPHSTLAQLSHFLKKVFSP